MGTRLTIPAPADYDLARDACSYGYFLLSPNHWDPRTGTFSRILDLADGPATVRVAQDGRAALRAAADRALSRGERTECTRLLARMLRLDEGTDMVRDFHRADPRWRKSGRARLFRSPTFFEDVIKTVTSCNVTWPSTVIMNRRLCEVVGRGGAFPDPRRLARTRAGTLRARCRVGYRDQRILELSRLFASRELDPAWFEDPATPDDAIHERLLELPGIGPYAAANIMQLLGRYSRLPLDTESLRHGRTILKMRGPARRIMKRLHAHYAPFGAHAFRSYWFEMWTFYEAKAGPSWTWERDSTGTTFTASQF
jgi:3-methyladenine DNA glycosylase/8-oxoguanine DNA glycosylase